MTSFSHWHLWHKCHYISQWYSFFNHIFDDLFPDDIFCAIISYFSVASFIQHTNIRLVYYIIECVLPVSVWCYKCRAAYKSQMSIHQLGKWFTIHLVEHMVLSSTYMYAWQQYVLYDNTCLRYTSTPSRCSRPIRIAFTCPTHVPKTFSGPWRLKGTPYSSAHTREAMLGKVAFVRLNIFENIATYSSADRQGVNGDFHAWLLLLQQSPFATWQITGCYAKEDEVGKLCHIIAVVKH